jgi:predicted nucleic acid-binding protein
MAKKRRSSQKKLDAFVLDASVTLAWYFSDEADPYADSVARAFPTVTAIVPAIWPLEIANAVLMGERRKRGTASATAQWMSFLTSLPIAVDDHVIARVFGDVITIARAHGLSIYDASYVELAIRSGLPLATLDDRLKSAAVAAGVRPFQP